MDKQKIGECRDRLIKHGLIEVEPGVRHKVTPVYTLLRLCAEKRAKKETKKETKTELNGNQTETKTETKTETLYKDIDIRHKTKEYIIFDDIAREEFFNDFFSEERRATIESLCLNNGTDEATLRRLAKEVLDDWQATSVPRHRDMFDAQRHLLSQIRVKMNVERRTEQVGTKQKGGAGRRAAQPHQSINDRWKDIPMPIL